MRLVDEARGRRRPTTPSEPWRVERAALLCVFGVNPVALTIEDLARALDTGDDRATFHDAFRFTR